MKRLSGWARLSLVVAGGWVLYGAWKGLEAMGDSPSSLTAFERWSYVGASALIGLLIGAISFGVSMAAKSVCLWVWRGFKEDNQSKNTSKVEKS